MRRRKEKKYVLFSDRGFNFLALGFSIQLFGIFQYHWALIILTTIIFTGVILCLFEDNRDNQWLFCCILDIFSLLFGCYV